MNRIVLLTAVALIFNSFNGLVAQDLPEIRRKGRNRVPKTVPPPALPQPAPKNAAPSSAPVTKNAEGIQGNLGYIEGTILDGDTKEPLINATVMVEGTQIGALTDYDGKFLIKNVPAGAQKLTVKYIGYLDKVIEVPVLAGKQVDLGDVELPSGAIGLDAVEIVAQVAVDKVTPVAVSTVDIQFRNERFGSQELPELLKMTPGVYASKSGGGFGDSRIAVRGFGQENVAVLINGIPVNDMENGRVFWSNWAGLSDVVRTLQVQRGLGASKIAINSVGGTLNLITKTTDIEKGGFLTLEGSNFYNYKATFSVSTGRTENGWAATFVGSRTWGGGYVFNTPIDAWSYFLSVSKEIGSRHILSFTALGAPQSHGQRLNPLTPATYDLRGDIRYNPDWGFLDGQVILTNNNYYHKPQIALNHYFSISSNTNLATSAYASFGRGGGSGNFFSTGTNFTARNPDGQWDYEAARRLNRTKLDTVMTSAGRSEIGYGSDVVVANSVNSHDWYGVLSTLNHTFAKNFKLLAGVDLRYYEGYHFREMENLLGGDFFVDTRNQNNPRNLIRKGGKFDYDYDSYIYWTGAFAQLEYSTKRISAFVSGTASETFYQRRDYFVKNDPAKGISQDSPTYDFFGYNLKSGINYRFTPVVNAFVNMGYFTRAPYYNSMFVDRRRSNDVVSNLTNEKIACFEAGTGFRFKKITFDVNIYYTDWSDKLFVIFFPDRVTNQQKGANASGLGARHYGIEIEGMAKPFKFLQVNFMGSIGDWRWKNDVSAVIIDEQGTETQRRNLAIKDLYVGNSAQTTAALGLRFQLTPQLYFIADYTYFARLFANFDPENRNIPEGRAFVRTQPWQAPDYGLVDLHLGYDFKFAGTDATIRGDVFNVFNKKYILEAQDGAQSNAATARVFYGFGTYFNIAFQIKF